MTVSAPVPPAEEMLYDTERTRVSRVRLADGAGGTIVAIRKEPLGPGAEQRVRYELAILTRLAGVAGVPQFAATSSPPGVIMLEDVEGVSMADRRPDAGQLIPVAVELTGVVAAVHRRGVVHKDINPSNIIVSRESGRICLIDFDLATTFAEERPDFAHQSQITGTLAYLAPEQTGRMGRPVDQRADLYALGATLYELATGAPPFGTGDALRLTHDHLARVPAPAIEANPQLPPALSDIIARLLEKEPDQRYQSAEGLLHDLARLGGDPGGRFRLGERDFPMRLAPPSRLVGRDAEIAALRCAFADALTGRNRGVLISGGPGVGKTALIDELRSIAAGSGGWFVSGKFDQLRQDSGSDAVRSALRALGRMLLAEPPSEADGRRAQLLEQLGPNAGLVAAVLPEFAVLLGVPPEAVTGEPQQIESRLVSAGLDLLRAVVSPQRPIVLVVDDLQWAQPTPLGLVDAVLADPDLTGVLLVGSYRDGEVHEAHPLAAMFARWQRLGIAPSELRLRNLPPADLGTMLAEMLRLSAEEGARLAAVVNERTGGNPYDTVELINSLRRDGALTSGPDGWAWDAGTVRRHLGRGDVAELLLARIEALPATTQALLESLGCLGAQVSMDLLEVATGLAAEDLAEGLRPALEDGLLVLEQGGERSVRFRHDRVQQAAYDHVAERRELQLRLARRLAARPGLEAVAAGQYLPAADAVLDPAERRRVLELFRAGAEQARLLSNHTLVERFITAAAALVEPDDVATRADVEIDRHLALYSLGRLDEADESYRLVERDCTEALRLAAATCVQVSSLTNRGRPPEAVALGLDRLRALGVTVPGPDEIGPAIGQGLAALHAWLAAGGEADDLRRPEITDPLVQAIARLVNRMLPAAYFCDQTVMAWLVFESAGLWATHGPAASLVGPFSHVAFVTTAVAQDYRTGYQAVRRVLAAGQARGYEPDTSQARFLYALGSAGWFGPLDEAARQADLAHEGLVRGGDLQNACFSYYASLPLLLDSSANLDTYHAEAEAGLAFCARTGNEFAAAGYLAHKQLIRALRGAATTPGRLDDDTFETGAYLASVEHNAVAVGNLHIVGALNAAAHGNEEALVRHAAGVTASLDGLTATFITMSAHLLQALALAGRVRAAAPEGPGFSAPSVGPGIGSGTAPEEPGFSAPSVGPGIGSGTEGPGFSMPSVGPGIGSGTAPEGPGFSAPSVGPGIGSGTAPDEAAAILAELDDCRAWLAGRAADAPANFGHLLLLVDAERAWAVGDFRSAATTFDTAQQEAARRDRPWHRALIAHRAALFYLAHGMDHVGELALGEARRWYERWGATGPVSELDRRYPFLRPGTDSGGRSADPTRSTTMDTGTIDLIGVVNASQALSSETNLHRLRARVVEVLGAMTGATAVRVVLCGGDAQGWFLPGIQGEDEPIPLADAEARGLVAASVFRYAERTREPILVADATRDDRFAGDPYVAGLEHCSMLAVPVLTRGELQAIVLLENTLSRGAFTTDRLDAVLLVAGQLAVSIDNALLYAALERKVAERTEALADANRRLEVLSITDPLTELANRRRLTEVLDAEWRRAVQTHRSIAVAMIDIDQFKPYNDHYGHPAGDKCLRMVAETLRGYVRDTDLVARYGGEEFAVILPGADITAAYTVAERMRAGVAGLRAPHERADAGYVTVSIGVSARAAAEDATPQHLIDAADERLYQAKHGGRNRVVG